jgi:hypothetical protein
MEYSKIPKLANITSSSTLRSFMRREIPPASVEVFVDLAPPVQEQPKPQPAPVSGIKETELGSLGRGGRIHFHFMQGDWFDSLLVLSFECGPGTVIQICWKVDEYLRLREILIDANRMLDQWTDDRLIVAVRIESDDLVVRRHDLGVIETKDGSVKFTLNRTEEESAFLSIEAGSVKVLLGRDELNDLEEKIGAVDWLFRLVPAIGDARSCAW